MLLSVLRTQQICKDAKSSVLQRKVKVHRPTLDFTNRNFNAALAAFPGVFLRVVVGQSSSVEHKPPRLPA